MLIADQVQFWLVEMLDTRPELRRRYRDWEPDLWAADFRTATFLSRDGDAFSFGRRSLSEYFLARHLARTLVDGAAGAWALVVPSPETLGFVGQSIGPWTPGRGRPRWPP